MLKFTKKGLIIVGSLLIVLGINLFFNTSFGVRIELSTLRARHEPRVHTLYFSQNNNIGLKVEDNQLIVTNGIVIGNNDSASASVASSIGGGRANTIDSNSAHAGIAGGFNNHISVGENSIIGGGRDNNINGNDAIIVGGAYNGSSAGGNVMGGTSNNAESGGVVLGGQGNTARENSLVLGSGAVGEGKSFSWNAEAGYNAARIDASNGVLIGTTQTKSGVNLVVNGAVKIGGTNSQTGVAGEIKVVNGCFYAYDGRSWHIVNRNTTGNCDDTIYVPKSCKFGNIELQDGDQVTGYNATLSEDCDFKIVTCNDGELLDDTGGTGYKYAYCYYGASSH